MTNCFSLYVGAAKCWAWDWLTMIESLGLRMCYPKSKFAIQQEAYRFYTHMQVTECYRKQAKWNLKKTLHNFSHSINISFFSREEPETTIHILNSHAGDFVLSERSQVKSKDNITEFFIYYLNVFLCQRTWGYITGFTHISGYVMISERIQAKSNENCCLII